ncbi:sugar ABC transporter substrate-binding protein [Ruminococcaceae bacterium OttesenSCG-928-A16]|nr:sugar ABC transporter substrate-binding protein [Ruminococcaceae bacterium OttesenSCG-928-A16]
MKMKKVLALALTVILSSGLLAGCSKQTPSPPSASPQPTSSGSEAVAPVSGKITFSIWDLNSNSYLQTLVDNFTDANPDIEVEIIDTPSDSYVSKLNIDLNGGAAADVILVKEADYSMYQKGQIADLSSYIERDGIDLTTYNGLAESLNFDGKQMGLPFRMDYYVLFYNKDIFDAAGTDYPSNDMLWADFEELAKQLTSGEGANKTYGAFLHTWQACVQNWAVQDGKQTMMGPDYSFMKPAYEMVLRMQNEDGTIQDYSTLKTANIHYSSPFQMGTVAMLPMGTWFMSTMIDRVNSGESEVNWAIATLPHPEGLAAGNTVGSFTPIVINKFSPNKDAAWEFVKYCATAEGAKVLAEAGQIPGCATDELRNIITSVEGMPEGASEAMATKGVVLDRPTVPFVNEVNQMLGEEHGLIMLGEVGLEEGLASMAERAKEIKGE